MAGFVFTFYFTFLDEKVRFSRIAVSHTFCTVKTSFARELVADELYAEDALVYIY